MVCCSFKHESLALRAIAGLQNPTQIMQIWNGSSSISFESSLACPFLRCSRNFRRTTLFFSQKGILKLWRF